MSFYEIIAAERDYHDLLPIKRMPDRPSAALIDAAHRWSAAIWAAARRIGPMPLTTQQISDGLRMAERPVFICGVHRSGTTLVRNLLDGHGSLSVLPSEGTFFTNLEVQIKRLATEDEKMSFLVQEWLRRLANPINQPPHWLLGFSEANYSPYIDFARYMISWWHVVGQYRSIWPHIAVMLSYASCTNSLGATYWVDKTPVNERYLN